MRQSRWAAVLVAVLALCAGCGAQVLKLPPMTHAQALDEADSTASDWTGDHLNTGFWEYSPVCHRLTASSFRCHEQTYVPGKNIRYAYLVMSIRMGPGIPGLFGGQPVPYDDVILVIQQYAKTGGKVLWLPTGTSRHFAGRIRHFT